jgi:hypothetical protein
MRQGPHNKIWSTDYNKRFNYVLVYVWWGFHKNDDITRTIRRLQWAASTVYALEGRIQDHKNKWHNHNLRVDSSRRTKCWTTDKMRGGYSLTRNRPVDVDDDGGGSGGEMEESALFCFYFQLSLTVLIHVTCNSLSQWSNSSICQADARGGGARSAFVSWRSCDRLSRHPVFKHMLRWVPGS